MLAAEWVDGERNVPKGDVLHWGQVETNMLMRNARDDITRYGNFKKHLPL